MGQRYFPNMPPMFEIDQDHRQSRRAAEESFNPLAPQLFSVAGGISVVQDYGSSSYPLENVMMGEAYSTSHRHMGGRSNGYFSSNLTPEGGHVRSAAPAPPYYPPPRPPSAQSYYPLSQNNSGHVYGGNYHGHHWNEFSNGLVNPVMNPERVSSKRKRHGISMACERDSRSRFYSAGSSSGSSQYHQEKACFNYSDQPSSSFPRGGGLSIGTDNHLRNVRSRPGVNLEANIHRSQLHSYHSHNYGSSQPSSHLVRTDLDLNSNITDPYGLPTNGNGRFTYPGNNGLICETRQHLAVSNVTGNGWHGSEPNISRNYMPPPLYNHGPHGHPLSNSSGPYGHPVINNSGHHFTSYLPPNRTNLSQYRGEHQVPQSDSGLQFPGTSRFSAPAYAGSWQNYQRDGRSMRFHSLYNTVDAHSSFRSQALISVDQSYLYGSRNVHDQYGDMRLDIDDMTYEELLALEERIGNVNTGLPEDAISKCLMETIHSASDNQQELTCAICLEEYEDKDEVGTLKNCGHDYHACCIRKWLLMKKSCPICKASAIGEK